MVKSAGQPTQFFICTGRAKRVDCVNPWIEPARHKQFECAADRAEIWLFRHRMPAVAKAGGAVGGIGRKQAMDARCTAAHLPHNNDRCCDFCVQQFWLFAPQGPQRKALLDRAGNQAIGKGPANCVELRLFPGSFAQFFQP